MTDYLATSVTVDTPEPASPKGKDGPTVIEAPHIAIMLGATLFLVIIFTIMTVMVARLRKRVEALAGGDGRDQWEHKKIEVPFNPAGHEATDLTITHLLQQEAATGWGLCTIYSTKKPQLNGMGQPTEASVLVFWMKRRKIDV